jgi:hypothetical protein
VTIVPEPTTTVAIVAAIGLAAVCRRPRVWAAYAARVGGGDCS